MSLPPTRTPCILKPSWEVRNSLDEGAELHGGRAPHLKGICFTAEEMISFNCFCLSVSSFTGGNGYSSVRSVTENEENFFFSVYLSCSRYIFDTAP